jgi:hypothetical protein
LIITEKNKQPAMHEIFPKQATRHYENGLYLAPTRIKTMSGHAQGLYCWYDVPANTLLGLYTGTLLTNSARKYLKFSDPDVYSKKAEYLWEYIRTQDQARVFIDPTNERGWMSDKQRKTNAMTGLNEPPPGTRANVFASHWYQEGYEDEIRFITCCPVEAGDEFYIHYGQNYSRTDQNYKAGRSCLRVPYYPLPTPLATLPLKSAFRGSIQYEITSDVLTVHHYLQRKKKTSVTVRSVVVVPGQESNCKDDRLESRRIVLYNKEVKIREFCKFPSEFVSILKSLLIGGKVVIKTKVQCAVRQGKVRELHVLIQEQYKSDIYESYGSKQIPLRHLFTKRQLMCL